MHPTRYAKWAIMTFTQGFDSADARDLKNLPKAIRSRL